MIKRLVSAGLLSLAAIAVYAAAYILLAPETPSKYAITDSSQLIAVDLDELDGLSLLPGISSEDTNRPRRNQRNDLLLSNFDSPLILAENTIKLATSDFGVEHGPRPDFYLSGAIDGTQSWQIDGLLLIETFVGGSVYSSAVIGDIAWLESAEGRLVSRLGRRADQFDANEVNVFSLMPNQPEFVLRIQLLSTKEDGTISPLYLVKESQ